MALHYRVPLPIDIHPEAEEMNLVPVADNVNIAREGTAVRRAIINNHFQ